MIVLLFGPPGCGKGTQAALLAQRLIIPAISTGEAFRAECQKGTELGKMASAIMKSGGLVGDDIVNGIVAARISQPDCAGGYLLDGYPRTVPQAMFLANFLRESGQREPIVIHLDVASDALVTRLTARRQCPECRRIYNLLSQPPRVAGECDDDRAPLLTRDDDQEAVIRRRLRAYQEQTGPILEWYGERMVQTIDGAAPADEVGCAILETVRRIVTARDAQELAISSK